MPPGGAAWLDLAAKPALAALTTIRDFAGGLVGSSVAAALTYLRTWNRVDLGGAGSSAAVSPADPC